MGTSWAEHSGKAINAEIFPTLGVENWRSLSATV